MKGASRSRDGEARRRLLFSLAIAVLVHGVLALVLLQVTRVRRIAPVHDAPAIRLRLIERPAPEQAQAAAPVRAGDTVQGDASTRQAAPRMQVPKRPREPNEPLEARTSTAAAARTRTPAAAEAAAQTAALPLRVFNRDGSVNLPDADSTAVAADPTAFGRRQRTPAYTPDPMAHRSPLPYEPTRFERDWAPRDESLLGEWLRRSTRTTSRDTRGGTRITCSAFLFFGGCGWGPAPRVTIEELKRMRADPPLPRPSPPRPETEADE
ncbi:MAG: hypothetical protein J0L88_02395 [Xanthomonadales bacterium]|nr:hypothetical protein [Xanthomonadales bacterium]